MDYGVGEFRFEAGDAGTTTVTWTYAFKPKRPLYAGPLRRFVRGDYRNFMTETLERMREHAAAWASDNPSTGVSS